MGVVSDREFSGGQPSGPGLLLMGEVVLLQLDEGLRCGSVIPWGMTPRCVCKPLATCGWLSTCRDTRDMCVTHDQSLPAKNGKSNKLKELFLFVAMCDLQLGHCRTD